MKLIVKKSCCVLTLRTGFFIICILSMVVFGLFGAVFPTIVDKIMKKLLEKSLTDPDLLKFVTPLLLMGPIVNKSGSDDGILEKSRELLKYYRHTYSDFVVDNLKIVMRALGFLLFIASCILLASWFQMNKYAGNGPDPGVFSCFAAVNPMNLNKRKSLKWWMLPWVVLECLFFFAMVLLTLDAALKISKYKVGIVALIVPPIAVVIIGLMQAYCIIVVVSYYYEQTASII